MRRWLSAFVACWALSAQAAPPVKDLTLAFDDFYTRTAQLPMAERVAEFRRTVGAQFPQFYGDERGAWTAAEQDARIAAAIKAYPALRDAYLKKARGFGAQLPGHIATFQQRFPDYRLPGDVWFVHGLGEMDGGTRELAGRPYLIFAADGMARYHGDNDEAAFFHHELFHTYHEPKLAACGEEVVWRRLWTEGLASYASHAMHPQASYQELLLDFPQGMVMRTQAQLPAAWDQLEQVLDSTDPGTNASLFQMGGKHPVLPPRRGYYLGYLVAQEAARTHSLAELAALGCKPARELVAATVGKMRGRSR
jgi:hypothetical protein